MNSGSFLFEDAENRFEHAENRREINNSSYEKEKITSIGRGQAVTSIKCGAGLSPVILFLFFSRHKHMLLWKL